MKIKILIWNLLNLNEKLKDLKIEYNNYKEKKIKLVYKKSLFKNYYEFKLLKSIDYNVIDKEKYDKMKNQWSFLVNFIYSLYGLVVKYIELEFIKHDCFMILVNNVNFLKNIYLDYLVKLVE